VSDVDEAQGSVRRLLLSGDTTLKNRDDPATAS
jgi:vancomycin permeability regulator SanA